MLRHDVFQHVLMYSLSLGYTDLGSEFACGIQFVSCSGGPSWVGVQRMGVSCCGAKLTSQSFQGDASAVRRRCCEGWSRFSSYQSRVLTAHYRRQKCSGICVRSEARM